MEDITKEQFLAWKHDPVTELLLQRIAQEREDMKEGIVNDAYENPEEVKGRCRAIAMLLEMDYHDLVPSNFVQQIEEMVNE